MITVSRFPFVVLCFLVCAQSVGSAESNVVIDAYPNIPQVSQGTTVVLICHVAGVPSDTMVTYQWSCPNYGCNVRGLQPDGNIPSRRQEGNIVVVDVVNTTDSGTYTCTVTSSGSSLGSGTYSIDEVNAGIFLTGRNGLIPVNSFLTDNSSILTPFEGTVGNYIRCGSIGGSPDWYRANGGLFETSSVNNNNYYYKSSNSAEFLHNTLRLAVNQEVECRPDSSLNLPSGWIGLFFTEPTKTIGQPIANVSSITTNSITLSWSEVTGTARYYVSYERTDLSISLTPTYIRLAGSSNTTVTIPGLEPGAMYRIRVWAGRDKAGASSLKAGASSPHEIHIKTNEEAPTAPRHLTVVGSTSTSVDLNWIPPLHPNGVIHYEIEYSTSENFVQNETINNTGSNKTHYVLSGLTPGIQYYVRVTARNSAGAKSSNVLSGISFNGDDDLGTTSNHGPVVAAVVVILFVLVLIIVMVVVIFIVVLKKRRNSKQSVGYEMNQCSHYNSSSEKPALEQRKSGKTVDLRDADSVEIAMSIYENVEKEKRYSVPGTNADKPVPVHKFPQYVQTMHNKGNIAFETEFESIEPKTSDPISAGEANVAKNRYKNIFPYDHSRVVLSVSTANGSDYINASYIDSYNKTNFFIAAQGPNPSTLIDFCQMIKDTRTTMVVMVTKVIEGTKRKCEQYYPDTPGETLTFGPYTLKTRTINHFVDFEVRTIEISSEGSSGRHAFDHYLFTGWPDYGVPEYPTSLLRMLYHVRERRITDTPIIVHCSAGVGRSGTFIALDCILDQINEENTVDIKGVVKKMREKRMLMVQTVDQYTFLYDAVRELLLCGDTSVRATDLRRHIAEFNKSGGFEQQFKTLGQLTQDRGDDKKATEDTDKVRYKDRLPVNGKHLFVPTASNTGTVFINASFVDGYHAPKAFIAAQSPMSNTVSDFWSLIVSKKVSVVALLCPLWERKKESCHLFWPDKEGNSVDYGTEYSVSLTETEVGDVCDVHRLSVTVGDRVKSLEVSLFHYKQWLEDGRPDLVSLLKYLMSVEKAKQSAGNHPVVVACNDGLGRSGTFIAIWSLIEQMKTEGQIDVLSTVKSIRTQRPGAVERLEYYISCYEALVNYVDTFEGYSNFNI